MTSDPPPATDLLLHVTAQALVEHAERRAVGMGCAPHEAVGAMQFTALALALRGEEEGPTLGRNAPPHILSALRLIADYNEQAGYVCCVVLPGGGAVFREGNIFNELADAWGAVERLKELNAAMRQALGGANLEV